MPKVKGESRYLEKRDGVVYYKGVRASEMVCYPICVVLAITGWSRMTLWREVQLGKIKMTRKKLIPRAELERYLREECHAGGAAL